MRSRSDVQARVVVGSLDPIDLGDSDERDLSGALDGQALQFSWKIFAKHDLSLGAVEGQVESRVVERLQEVIERSGLESPQRIICLLYTSQTFSPRGAITFAEDNTSEPGAQTNVANEMASLLLDVPSQSGRDLNTYFPCLLYTSRCV